MGLNVSEPPKWAARLLTSFCNDHLRDAVLGDLEELYARRRTRMSKLRADLLFAIGVLQFFQPFALRKSKHQPVNQSAMFRNYITVTWRSMTRQKMYTAIKIGGFALGLAICIVIFLFVRSELSYDNYYVGGENIYRMYNDYNGPDGGKWTSFPPAMAPLMKAGYGEVEKAARLIPYKWFNAGSNLFRRDDQPENLFEEGFAYADPELPDLLQFRMVYGDRAKALEKPFSLLISRKIANKYFPGENPIGKVVILNDDKAKPYTIGGVMEDLPSNSHIRFDFFLTLVNVEFWEGEQASWCCWNYNVYLQLRPDADVAALAKKSLAIRDKHYLGYLKETGNKSFDDTQKHHFFRLQNVKDIHLHSADISDAVSHGDPQYVMLFGGIACFILVLACINFINLSTAKSANRAKEVGLRKVVGSARSYIVRQFLVESVLYSLVAFVIALVLVWLTLPYFNDVAAKSLTLPWGEWWFIPGLLAAAVLTGFMAGLYPAFYLSAFKPIDVLKGAVSRGSKTSTLRGVMVVFQFTTSIVLIIGTVIIYRQMSHILHTKVGFDRDQVVMIQGTNTIPQADEFRTELKRLAGVQYATMGNYLPVYGTNRDQNEFWREGKSKEEKAIGAQRWYVDEDFIPALGMKLTEGRNFDPLLASDSMSIIISQTMAHEFGFKKPIGERIGNWRTYTVIGVVEDFRFESLKERIYPVALVRGKGGSVTSIKVNSHDIHDMLTRLTAVWNKFMPNQPIRYTFLDESYARMYDDVQRMGRIFAAFAILAISVACLGLFALAAFMVEQRSKEISIRIVLGATVQSVFRLLTQNFVKLVLISFVIAVPAGWFMMKRWLEEYQERVPMTWDIFALAGFLALAIALSTVSYQAIRAALVNPAEKLRSE